MALTDTLSNIDLKYKVAPILLVVMLLGFASTQVAQTSNSFDNRAQSHSASTLDLGTAESGDTALARDTTAGTTSTTRKTVTTIRTTLEVKNIEKAVEDISTSVENNGGLIESTEVNEDIENTGSMRVAIPEQNISKFESQIGQNYNVKRRSVNRDDVTDSYNELETEIESLKAEHRRLKDLINQTESVENLIKLQERMSEVRSQINYKEDRLSRLQKDISYTEVYITLEGPETFQSQFNLDETFSQAYQGIFTSVKYIIIGSAYLIPFAGIYLIYRLVKAFKNKKGLNPF